jgi:hypothetical protein
LLQGKLRAGDNVIISWEPLAPRGGVAGAVDRLIGPGVTPAELRLVLLCAVLAALVLPVHAVVYEDVVWGVVQVLLAGLLAFDLAGGVTTANATSSAKRWYRGSGQGLAQHLGFVLVHGVQIFLVAWLFRSMDWPFFAAVYGYLVAASVVILASPLYLQRPAVISLLCGALLLSAYALIPTPGLEWFAPLLFLKLLVSHLLKAAPYHPRSAS